MTYTQADEQEALECVNYNREHAHKAAANFWFYGIIAGIVWFFASWQWALIPLAPCVWSAYFSFRCSIEANRVIALFKPNE